MLSRRRQNFAKAALRAAVLRTTHDVGSVSEMSRDDHLTVETVESGSCSSCRRPRDVRRCGSCLDEQAAGAVTAITSSRGGRSSHGELQPLSSRAYVSQILRNLAVPRARTIRA